MTHRVRHRRSGDLKHSRGGALEIYAQRMSEPLPQGALGGISIEAHFASKESFGRKPAEDHVGIGNRGLSPAPPVTRRSWLRPRASRTDVESTAFVEPTDAAATGSYFHDIEHRDAHREPFIVAADKIIGRQTGLAASNHGCLRRGAAHVESNGGFEIKRFTQRHRANNAGRGPGFHHLNALASRQL